MSEKIPFWKNRKFWKAVAGVVVVASGGTGTAAFFGNEAAVDLIMIIVGLFG